MGDQVDEPKREHDEEPLTEESLGEQFQTYLRGIDSGRGIDQGNPEARRKALLHAHTLAFRALEQLEERIEHETTVDGQRQIGQEIAQIRKDMVDLAELLGEPGDTSAPAP